MLPPGQKVFLLLDQFEQWLFARRGEENTELVAALRHCDGEHVQAVALVRDDFWMAATRCMNDLEIRLVEGDAATRAPLEARLASSLGVPGSLATSRLSRLSGVVQEKTQRRLR